MLVKDEIGSICNLPSDGDLTRDAALKVFSVLTSICGLSEPEMIAKIFHRQWTEMRHDLKGRWRPNA